jgi:hypothetical protein
MQFINQPNKILGIYLVSTFSCLIKAIWEKRTMKKIVIVVSALSFSIVAKSFAAEFKNYQSPGSLESKYDIGCVGSEKLENKYTPADLFKAFIKCTEQEKYKEGTFLFVLAGVYGRFDTFRVADQTAHQAVTVLRMQAFEAMEKSKKSSFMDTTKKTLGTPEILGEICKDIQRIGPPNYYPRYMIQHGMGAFTKSGATNDLLPDFDPATGWKKSLDTYLHCPGL